MYIELAASFDSSSNELSFSGQTVMASETCPACVKITMSCMALGLVLVLISSWPLSCVGVSEGIVCGERLQDHAEQVDNQGGQAQAGAGGYPE